MMRLLDRSTGEIVRGTSVGNIVRRLYGKRATYAMEPDGRLIRVTVTVPGRRIARGESIVAGVLMGDPAIMGEDGASLGDAVPDAYGEPDDGDWTAGMGLSDIGEARPVMDGRPPAGEDAVEISAGGETVIIERVAQQDSRGRGRTRTCVRLWWSGDEFQVIRGRDAWAMIMAGADPAADGWTDEDGRPVARAHARRLTPSTSDSSPAEDEEEEDKE